MIYKHINLKYLITALIYVYQASAPAFSLQIVFLKPFYCSPTLRLQALAHWRIKTEPGLGGGLRHDPGNRLNSHKARFLLTLFFLPTINCFFPGLRRHSHGHRGPSLRLWIRHKDDHRPLRWTIIQICVLWVRIWLSCLPLCVCVCVYVRAQKSSRLYREFSFLSLSSTQGGE